MRYHRTSGYVTAVLAVFAYVGCSGFMESGNGGQLGAFSEDIVLLKERIAGHSESDDPLDRERAVDETKLLVALTGIDATFVGRQATSLDQCSSIGYGSKFCGGPLGYIVYSNIATNSTRLSSFVTAYNQQQRYINHKYGGISDCGWVGPPVLELVDGMCTSSGYQAVLR